jgi:CheY-like chemotaxis protein
MDGRGRILLVDDDRQSLEMLSEYLADEGYTVETAPDGLSALAKLSAFHADVVVTDLEMPGMDGLELIRLIEARYPGRPTVLVTARDDADLPAALAAGTHPGACMRKPIDLEDLGLVVRRLVNGARVA